MAKKGLISHQDGNLSHRIRETGRQWIRIASYFPLVAIGLEVLWVVVLFLGFIFMVGDAPYTNTVAKERLFDFVAALPATLGLLLALLPSRGAGPVASWNGYA